ncbi:hypothetical protein ILYODFUR_003464 [Ilyodon furcidens]|uniref:Uncharacterized protein n=1 Tax=Ilyodon furcidens TaxID=33524 RepID=A0ABV0TU88_9TELE
MVTGSVAIRENTYSTSGKLRVEESKRSEKIKDSKRLRRRGFIKQRLVHLSFYAQFFLSLWPINVSCQTDMTLNLKIKKKTFKRPKHNNMQSLSISCSKTRRVYGTGFCKQKIKPNRAAENERKT